MLTFYSKTSEFLNCKSEQIGNGWFKHTSLLAKSQDELHGSAYESLDLIPKNLLSSEITQLMQGV